MSPSTPVHPITATLTPFLFPEQGLLPAYGFILAVSFTPHTFPRKFQISTWFSPSFSSGIYSDVTLLMKPILTIYRANPSPSPRERGEGEWDGEERKTSHPYCLLWFLLGTYHHIACCSYLFILSNVSSPPTLFLKSLMSELLLCLLKWTIQAWNTVGSQYSFCWMNGYRLDALHSDLYAFLSLSFTVSKSLTERA